MRGPRVGVGVLVLACTGIPRIARADSNEPLRLGRERAVIFAFDDVVGWERDRYSSSRTNTKEDHVGLFPGHGPRVGVHVTSESGITAGLVSSIWVRTDGQGLKGANLRMNLRFGKIFSLSPSFAIWLRAGPSATFGGTVSSNGVITIDVGAEALVVWSPLRTSFSNVGITLGPHGMLPIVNDQLKYQAFGVGAGVQWAF